MYMRAIDPQTAMRGGARRATWPLGEWGGMVAAAKMGMGHEPQCALRAAARARGGLVE